MRTQIADSGEIDLLPEDNEWSREDLVVALIDNLQACRSDGAGPSTRIVPESLCLEIEYRLRESIPLSIAGHVPASARVLH